ncbi:MAG TPA: tyrosine-type recombinase/integrase [Solirubrobacteraceae bacterium]
MTRYETADGRRCAKADPGARKVATTSESYYLFLPPKAKGGKRRCVPLGTADLAVAWRKARQVLEDEHNEELGILSDAGRQAARPIAEHVEEWLAGVAAGGAQAARVALLRARVTRLIALAGWRRIGDIRKSSCEAALAALKDEAASGVKGLGVGRGKGASAQTRNHYLAHARQFCAWLAADGRAGGNPLATVRRANVAVDRRHDRRCPGEDDVRVLFAHLGGQQAGHPPRVRRTMTGPHRALAYQVAMCAGLRAGELRRLTRASFDLAAGEVRVTAASDKARKRRAQQLPRWLCDKLAAWFGGGGAAWGGLAPDGLGEMLRADLAAARAGWLAEVPEGTPERQAREASAVCAYEAASEDGPLYLDVHALRHWFVTQIASTDGISPATLQAMARHSDPRLTLETYSHPRRADARAAVERLPRLDGG